MFPADNTENYISEYVLHLNVYKIKKANNHEEMLTR